VRFHADGRLGVPTGATARRSRQNASAQWFSESASSPSRSPIWRERGRLRLSASQLTVEVVRRPEYGAFLLGFERADGALEAAAFISRRRPEAGFPPRQPQIRLGIAPRAHAPHVAGRGREVLARGSRRAVVGHRACRGRESPARPSRRASREDPRGAAYLFVDFPDLADGATLRGGPRHRARRAGRLGPESVRLPAERFRPQQAKRSAPGSSRPRSSCPRPRFRSPAPPSGLAHNAGNELDAEVYYLATAARSSLPVT